MPYDPPQTNGGPGDSTPHSMRRLHQMVVDDALLAAFERTRWPHRAPASDVALAIAAPIAWLLTGEVAGAAVAATIVAVLLLASALMWWRDQRQEARTLLVLGRWTVVAFVLLACLAAIGRTPSEQQSRQGTGPARPTQRYDCSSQQRCTPVTASTPAAETSRLAGSDR
jgi:hypothetical protein